VCSHPDQHGSPQTRGSFPTGFSPYVRQAREHESWLSARAVRSEQPQTECTRGRPFSAPRFVDVRSSYSSWKLACSSFDSSLSGSRLRRTAPCARPTVINPDNIPTASLPPGWRPSRGLGSRRMVDPASDNPALCPLSHLTLIFQPPGLTRPSPTASASSPPPYSSRAYSIPRKNGHAQSSCTGPSPLPAPPPQPSPPPLHESRPIASRRL
jgi:hypothetical protein